jgi:hypothetical protein
MEAREGKRSVPCTPYSIDCHFFAIFPRGLEKEKEKEKKWTEIL